MMKKKILFISRPQFGYQIDYYNYCKYLIDEFEITYVCYDYGNEKIFNENIEIIYIKLSKKRVDSERNFLREVSKLIKSNNFDIGFVYYFIGCSLLPLLYSKQRFKFILDIRSGSVTPNTYKRNLINLLIKLESTLYQHLTIISEGLRNKLFLSKRKSSILPLGCDPIPTTTKYFSSSLIHLLYIGTFNNRNIQETILGLHDFLIKNPNRKKSIFYTIIGTGDYKTVLDIENIIRKTDLTEYVHLRGYIKTTDLFQYFENANIGISFVPMTTYFDNQPPTKTYEYLQAGMPVIATATKANKSIINKFNGVLIKDTYADFSEKLGHIIDNFDSYDSIVIKKTVENNTWQIITNRLIQLLHSIEK